ncbi:MAG TPA: hypothetical protein VLV83_12065, partial [Acidobacteriota bacterium]|nr:hypothetical protein [Acidobacteriota bacterium]
LQAALRGGEDYALLFSLDPARAGELEDCPLPRGQQRAVIGRLEPGPPSIRLKPTSGESRPLEMTGYQHFGDHPDHGGDRDDQQRDNDSGRRPGGQGRGEGHA